MNVLVVGGAGFIGSHLTERLLAEGHAVDVVDDLSTGNLSNLSDARTAGGDLKIHTLSATATEFAALVAIRQPSVIFHLGWLPPGRSGAAVAGAAVHSTVAVLEAARAVGAKVVTTVPAGWLYGEVPARELPVKEGRAWEPIGLAGVLARTVADLLAAHRADHAVEFTALAVTTVYGARQRSDASVVAAFHEAHRERRVPTVHGDGRQTRDFLFIDDAVDALVRAATRGSGLVVNIGTGVQTSIRDLWTHIAGLDAPALMPAPYREPDLSRVAVSPTRARIHLSWAPWTELAVGLRSIR